jgi:hypothetical protein
LYSPRLDFSLYDYSGGTPENPILREFNLRANPQNTKKSSRLHRKKEKRVSDHLYWWLLYAGFGRWI